MKTQDEIAHRIKELDSNQQDMLGFQREVLINCLDFEHATRWLKSEAPCSPEEWNKGLPRTRDDVLVAMRDYMSFAWGKVEDHRGISATRSVEKMEAWIWVLGDDETLKKVQAASYAVYGAPQLKVVCDQYGFPVPTEESMQNMIAGMPCAPGCESGCRC